MKLRVRDLGMTIVNILQINSHHKFISCPKTINLEPPNFEKITLKNCKTICVFRTN